ncbi:hypothetical protein [Emcibacter nanhaiensis]|uniref:hypothetical protein n=1 Tax=Emcibacter nanhaiensis TaxID=1505037 RepID=UPI0015E3D856|nr:hypothetical protein [Emcibacter nanhaiensis]
MASLVAAAVVLVACAPRRGPGPGPGPGRGPGNPEEMMERLKYQLDLDGDGTISCADENLRRNRLFDETDLDHNDSLDLEEFREAPFSHPAYARDHLAVYDRDQDGLVSREEFTAHRDDRFVRLDLDGDCIVTDKELEESLKNRRQPGRPGGGMPPGGGRPPGGM